MGTGELIVMHDMDTTKEAEGDTVTDAAVETEAEGADEKTDADIQAECDMQHAEVVVLADELLAERFPEGGTKPLDAQNAYLEAAARLGHYGIITRMVRGCQRVAAELYLGANEIDLLEGWFLSTEGGQAALATALKMHRITDVTVHAEEVRLSPEAEERFSAVLAQIFAQTPVEDDDEDEGSEGATEDQADDNGDREGVDPDAEPTTTTSTSADDMRRAAAGDALYGDDLPN